MKKVKCNQLLLGTKVGVRPISVELWDVLRFGLGGFYSYETKKKHECFPTNEWKMKGVSCSVE